MQNLNIAIIGHIKYKIKEPFLGGLEAFTHNLATKLLERGHNVTVFAAEGSDPKINCQSIGPASIEDKANTAYPKYEIEDVEVTPYREYLAYSKLMHKLKNSDFDIVHNNSLHHVVNSFSNILPMPMLTTLHTPPFAWIATSFFENNYPITISKYMQKIWFEILGETQVIYNGIDLKKFNRFNNIEKQDHAIWFGRITPEKGVIYAIEAARKANINLRLAGAIYDQEYFDQRIKPNLDEQIIYLGHLSHNELRRAMCNSSLSLCTPSWDEPYGLVVAEALACGLPVAAFDRGAIKEILDKKTGVLAKPDDSSNLAEAIKKAKKLEAKNCRARAEKIASIEKMIDQYIALYKKLINEKR